MGPDDSRNSGGGQLNHITPSYTGRAAGAATLKTAMFAVNVGVLVIAAGAAYALSGHAAGRSGRIRAAYRGPLRIRLEARDSRVRLYW